MRITSTIIVALFCINTPAHFAHAKGDSAPGPSMQISQPDLSIIWNDPGFQKSFIGGYGINPDIEPRVSQDDMALLELVRQLMADELPAAEALLKDSVKLDLPICVKCV